ncbi:MAG: PilN domain-containing protein [Candidatus Saccharimonadales bacterium]
MIQLNLLPDVKMEYIKAQRTRSLVLSSAVIIALGSIALLVLLLVVGGLQKKHISDLTKDIKTDTATLQKKPEITKILTVQNQLQSLTALHEQKPAVSNLFGYLNEVTPTQVDITNFDIDFTTQVVTITGTADSLGAVNKYVDTLKFTTYEIDGDQTKQKAFKDVVLSSFGVSDSGQGRAANYSITFSYDPNIFDVSKKVTLAVPNLTTTRSAIEQPVEELFQAAQTSGGGN